MMEYPWRFEGPKVGDKVFAITIDADNNRYINEVTIADIQDNSYYVQAVNGEFTTEVVRHKDWEEYNIGYWVEGLDLGSALYFGLSLFLALEEAMESLEHVDKEGEDHE